MTIDVNGEWIHILSEFHIEKGMLLRLQLVKTRARVCEQYASTTGGEVQPVGKVFNQWAGRGDQASGQNREKILGRQALLHSGAQTGTSGAPKMQLHHTNTNTN